MLGTFCKSEIAHVLLAGTRGTRRSSCFQYSAVLCTLSKQVVVCSLWKWGMYDVLRAYLFILVEESDGCFAKIPLQCTFCSE